MTAMSGAVYNRHMGTTIIVLVFAAVLLATIGLSISHAEARHGSDALTVRNCLENNGPDLIFDNPTRGTKMVVCYLDDNHYGIQIIRKVNGKWEEVTAFIRRNAKSWDDLLDWAEGTGAHLRWLK
jgi:hypothetical protein